MMLITTVRSETYITEEENTVQKCLWRMIPRILFTQSNSSSSWVRGSAFRLREPFPACFQFSIKGCPEFSTGCFLEEIYLRLSILPNESHNATYEVVKAVQWIWCSIFFQFSLPTQSGTANVAAQSAKTVVISNGIGSSVLLFLSFVHSFHRRMNYRVSFRIVLGTAAFFAFLTTLLPLQTERVRLGCYCCEWLQPGSRWHVWCHSWLSWILNHLGQAYRVGAE